MNPQIKTTPREDGPHDFNYQHEATQALYRATGVESWGNGSLYERVDHLEEYRIFSMERYEPEDKLELLAKEIKVRVSITAQEIFIIGELLTQAKKICQQEKIGFKNWISETFDFSYETANNFKNVYKFCFAYRPIAVMIPPSILYKLSEPSFPDELREYLFTHVYVDELDNEQVKNLATKYKEGGFEAVKKNVDAFTKGGHVQRQIQNVRDEFENALRFVEKFHKKASKGQKYDCGLGTFEGNTDAYEDEAKHIVRVLYEGLDSAYETMKQADKKANEIHGSFIDSVKNDLEEV